MTELDGNTDAFEALVTEYEAASGSEMLSVSIRGVSEPVFKLI